MKESVRIDIKELLQGNLKDLEYLKDIEPFVIEEPSMVYKNEMAEIVKAIQELIVGIQEKKYKSEVVTIEEFSQLINDSIDMLELIPEYESIYVNFKKNIFTIVKKQVKKQDVNDFTKTYINTIFGTEQDKISIINYDIIEKHIIHSFFLVSSVYYYLKSKTTKTYITSTNFKVLLDKDNIVKSKT